MEIHLCSSIVRPFLWEYTHTPLKFNEARPLKKKMLRTEDDPAFLAGFGNFSMGRAVKLCENNLVGGFNPFEKY